MTLSSNAVENLRAVEADLNYLAPTTERPRTYAYDPPPDVPRSTGVNASHRVPIRDARPIATEIILDELGFGLIEHRSAVRDFYDDDEVKRVYYPETENALKDATGAARVFIFDHTVRRRVPGAEDRRDGIRQPASRVHVDHTAKSGPQRVRDLLADEAALRRPAAFRSSIFGGRFAARCGMRRLRSATRARWRRRIWYLRISSIRTASARPIRSPIVPRIDGSISRRCARTRPCC
jgi:hypothetical protein